VSRSRSSLVCALAALVDACGGAEAPPIEPQRDETATSPALPYSGTESGEVDGTVDGTAFAVASARLFVGPLSERPPLRTGVRIVVSTQAGLCDRPDVLAAGKSTLRIDFEPASVGAGTYSVGPGRKDVAARVEARSESCTQKTIVVKDGSVSLEAIDRDHARGTFELKIGKDRVRGRFEALACPSRPPPPLALRCE
jgi:hypothetical protein